VFWATIPFALATSSPEARLPEAPLHANALQGARLLVVDDSDINLFVAERILRDEGALVTLATDGRQAIEQLRTSAQPFEVVLMDVQMPVMDGYQATELIREQISRALPIIGLTADARTSERDRALRAGMTDFLSKPFEPRELIARVARLLPPRGSVAAADPVPLLGDASGQAWPDIDGIDGARARELLNGDVALFRRLLLRLVNECRDLSPPSDLQDQPSILDYAARVHAVRGAFGQLGATKVQALAERLEVGFRSGEAARVLHLAASLQEELKRVSCSARVTFGSAPGQEVQRDSSVVAPERAALTSLLERLRQQDLAALEAVRALSSWGRRAWGDEPFERFLQDVEGLRFSAAAELLARKLGSTAPASRA
jgi:CheY-like chemotaxis protein/HPt (histidine-containing phosphotransfer) domain-containing protein